MNVLYYFMIMISLVNGYCENFCYNNTCDKLNGYYISECGECPKIYKCNSYIVHIINISNFNNLNMTLKI